VQTFAKI
jgi:hypothetical protein